MDDWDDDWDDSPHGASPDGDGLSVEDLFFDADGRWIGVIGHVEAARFCSLAFDFARRQWGAAEGGEWLASFGGDEVMAASIWWGWLRAGEEDEEGMVSATVLEGEEDGAWPITTMPW